MPVPGSTMTSFRPLMQGANGMVVASHPAAAMAGLDVLRKGGNAIEMYPDWWEGSSLYCAIKRNPETKVLQGGADPRCEAYAIGY